MKELKGLLEKANDELRRADYDSALETAREILGGMGSLQAVYAVAGIMIDAGYGKADEEVVREGVRLLEERIDALMVDKMLAPSTIYNLANGYSAIAGLKLRSDPGFALFSDTELNTAKLLYLFALKLPSNNNRPDVLVNLGNTYDHLGRVLDALEYYEKAMRLDCNHAMAIGNKGYCLYYYSTFSDHSGTYLREAHSLIRKALALGVHSDAAGRFRTILDKIESRFKDKRVLDVIPHYPGITVENDSDIENGLQDFCLKEKLYLNICNYCQNCNGAVGDPEVIKKMMQPLNNCELTGHSFDADPFLKLSGYLNQIKQAYVSTRFLLFLSQYEGIDLRFVDRRVLPGTQTRPAIGS